MDYATIDLDIFLIDGVAYSVEGEQIYSIKIKPFQNESNISMQNAQVYVSSR